MTDLPNTTDGNASVSASNIRRLLIVATAVAAILGSLWWFTSGKFIHEAKIAVANKFLDPESVQFRRVRTVDAVISPNVCGEVNAKNAFGAYVGFVKFIHSGYGNPVIGPKEGDPDRPGWNILSKPCEPWPKD